MDPVVPDEGICHADDLAAERWIRGDLLIADHGGCEDDFTLRVDGRAEASASKHPTIRERQGRISRWGVPPAPTNVRNRDRQRRLTRHGSARLRRRRSSWLDLAAPFPSGAYSRHVKRAIPAS